MAEGIEVRPARAGKRFVLAESSSVEPPAYAAQRAPI
jgi:hypothetical protein